MINLIIILFFLITLEIFIFTLTYYLGLIFYINKKYELLTIIWIIFAGISLGILNVLQVILVHYGVIK